MAEIIVRKAELADVEELNELIRLSAVELQRGDYSAEQIGAALGDVFAVDRQLIEDGTYWVAEHGDRLVGCGGWSRRHSYYGGDADRTSVDRLLDPATEAARIRAFFVHPDFARQGIGRRIMQNCEHEIAQAGFSEIEIVATLAGVRLYERFGYQVTLRHEIPLQHGFTMQVCDMHKLLT